MSFRSDRWSGNHCHSCADSHSAPPSSQAFPSPEDASSAPDVAPDSTSYEEKVMSKWWAPTVEKGEEERGNLYLFCYLCSFLLISLFLDLGLHADGLQCGAGLDRLAAAAIGRDQVPTPRASDREAFPLPRLLWIYSFVLSFWSEQQKMWKKNVFVLLPC